MALINLKRRIRALFRKESVEEELNEELQYHLDREVERQIAAGASVEEARLAALRSFGGLEQSREACRDARQVRLLEDVAMDVRYGVRTLLNNPGFTIVAVIALGLGIGANTAIFSVVNGVLLKPLPFPDAGRLVAISETSQSGQPIAVAYADYLDWRAQALVFEDAAARMPAGGVLTGDGGPQRVTGRMVTASFFRTLGVQPQTGRFFTEAEDRPGAEPVMVLSHGLWQRRYGADPHVAGRAVQFNGESWTIIGVAPAHFDFYGENNLNNEFFIPLGRISNQRFMHDRKSHTVLVTARLKKDVSLEQARKELAVIATRLSVAYPESNKGVSVRIRPLLDDYVGDTRPALLVLAAAVAVLLLIACANTANLLLARTVTRRKDIALRIALGASRSRIVRQLVTESLVLAAAGGILGLAIGAVGTKALIVMPDALPRVENISLDGGVIAFTMLLTFATAIAFGLAPALQSSKSGLNDAVKEGSARSSAGVSGRRLRSALVACEVALCLVLLVSAGLLLRSFSRLMNVEPGFDARNVLTMRLRLPDAKYRDPAAIARFLEQIVRRVEVLPGVEHVSLSTGFPFGRAGENGYVVEGQPEPREPRDWADSYTQSVSETYHRTLGIRLLAGRYFTDRDRADSPPVVIVDDELVRRHFGSGSFDAALGKRLRFGGDGEPWREIVGVVGHVRQYGLDEDLRPGIYRPWTQISARSAADYTRAMDLIVKASVEPATLVAAISREVQAIDKDQPLGNVRTVEALIEQSVAPRRFSLLIVTIFAAVAMLLGAVGLYGVLSYTVTERSREMGIRMALGAKRRDVTRLILSEGLTLAAVGAAAGVLIALGVTRWMSSLLFGVSPTDPVTFASIVLLLMATAALACYVPARRATRVDPILALRSE